MLRAGIVVLLSLTVLVIVLVYGFAIDRSIPHVLVPADHVLSAADAVSDADGSAAPTAARAANAPAAAPTIDQAAEEALGIPPNATEMPVHSDQGLQRCNEMLSERLVDNWRQGERLVCEDAASGVRVREFVQHGFEYRPQIYVYENVDFESPVGAILSNGCPTETFHTGEFHNENQPWARGDVGRSEYLSRQVKSVSDRVLMRIKRFDVFNPYEAFHAFINAYFHIRVLNISQYDVQFAFTDDDCGDSPKNELMWNSINGGRHPIIFTKNNGVHRTGMYDGVAYRYRMAVRASSTGTSILCSNQPPLASRGADHHCKSAAFREAMAWMRHNFGTSISWSLRRPLKKHRVIFASRKPYTRTDLASANGPAAVFTIPRMLANEELFVSQLNTHLKSHGATAEYEFKLVNFGELTPAASIEEATNADIILGVHGAGLMWAGFLPRHGGLVELFPDGLQHVNRHYHNVASLADLHYRDLPMNIHVWGSHEISVTAQAILSIPLHQARAEP
jgi:hypothetical protein